MFILVDCNNFFVSCERVFRPDLEHRPVVVLSGNDGCVVSRSNEAKALGIAMGVPLYQIKQMVAREGVVCFSSNFPLYGDLSDRVMSILRASAVWFEQYSIDEAFLKLPEYDTDGVRINEAEYMRRMVAAIRKGVGIPVSVGIAPSKTLAKVASKYAKKYAGYKGVCVIDSDEKRRKALDGFDISDVWGIGRKATQKLKARGIDTALKFAEIDGDGAEFLLHKPGLLTWKELNGADVIDITSLPSKQSISTTRTFATALTDRVTLEGQLAGFCDACAVKLRRQHSLCSQIIVFAHTSRFRTDIEQQYILEAIQLQTPTANTGELTEYALKAFRKQYKKGILYKKCGVVLTKITPDSAVTQDLFDTRDRQRDTRLQTAIDAINTTLGKHSVMLGSQLSAVSESAPAVYRSDNRSPRYTTNLGEVIKVKC